MSTGIALHSILHGPQRPNLAVERAEGLPMKDTERPASWAILKPKPVPARFRLWYA